MHNFKRWATYQVRSLKYQLYERIAYKKLENNIRSSLVVLPADPFKVIGSKGDEALLVGAFDWLRANKIDSPISLIVAEDINIPRFDKYNLTCIKTWSKSGLKGYIKLSETFSQASHFLVFGADVMDGHYSSSHVQRVASYARLAAANGIKTTILGFSFNNSPSQEAVLALRELPSETIINIRDPLSHARFIEHVNRDARLVADTGFLLKPKDDSEIVLNVGRWVQEQRKQNRIILGLNLHPMLLTSNSDISHDHLVTAGIKVVERALQENCSIILIPHDTRDKDGDARTLKPIFSALDEKQRANVLYIEDPFGAEEAKAICAFLDFVITGRMHLAIAALGMGKPVGCVTYQDKFEGLIAHFQLDKSVLLSAEEFIDVNKALDHFINILSTREKNVQAIQKNLGRVLELAELNLYEFIRK